MNGRTMKASTMPAVRMLRAAALERRPGLDARDAARAACSTSQGTTLVLHERHDDEEADHAEDDAGDRGQHLDGRADDPPTAGCTSSTSSSAMTSASGTAMTIATMVERTVPASAARAPYWPVRRRPVHGGEDLGPEAGDRRPRVETRTAARPNIATATARPHAVARTRKTGSPSRRRPRGAASRRRAGPSGRRGTRSRLYSRFLPPE